jgi:hypothetical protein
MHYMTINFFSTQSSQENNNNHPPPSNKKHCPQTIVAVVHFVSAKCAHCSFISEEANVDNCNNYGRHNRKPKNKEHEYYCYSSKGKHR